jgi:predicted nucleic acid-binding protein
MLPVDPSIAMRFMDVSMVLEDYGLLRGSAAATRLVCRRAKLCHYYRRNLGIRARLIGVLLDGIERLPVGVRRTLLDGWLKNDLLSRFVERILPVNVEVPDACGRLGARADSLGHPIEARDGFIAATAEVHGLTLITRNGADFSDVLKSILSPWS